MGTTSKLIHIGAHRTGTTSAQNFLKKNGDLLRCSGIDVKIPPVTRASSYSEMDSSVYTIVSEENILGRMEKNVTSMTLYPDLAYRFGSHSEKLKNVDTVLLSIRDLREWWRSVILFSCGRELPFPNSEIIDQIAKNKRSWVHVVEEIKRNFPNAKLFVHEFGWKQGNPKQLFRRVTGLKIFDDCKNEHHRHNKSPSIELFREKLLKRDDYESLSRLENCIWPDIFSDVQLRLLEERYLRDCDTFRSSADIEFLACDRNEVSQEDGEITEKTLAPAKRRKLDHTCLLNISKAGSEIFRNRVGSENLTRSGIELCNHDETIASTRSKFGADRSLMIFFRDPLDRFYDNFVSRLRQGRPEFDSPWSAEEASAFHYFASPSDLGEALSSSDDRLLSAARFAMENIFDIKHSYQFYMTSAAAVEYELKAGNLLVCCEYTNVNKNYQEILLASKIGQKFGPESSELTETNRLSSAAYRNLSEWFSEDLLIYEACRVAANTLGFGDN